MAEEGWELKKMMPETEYGPRPGRGRLQLFLVLSEGKIFL